MRIPRSELRAFLLAPLAAPLGYWIALLAWGVIRATSAGDRSLPSPRSVVVLLGLVLAVGAPVAYGAALVGGIPAYLLLRRLGIVGRVSLWAAGALIGAAVAALMAPGLGKDLIRIPFPPWAGAALGIVTAETFWRLHRRPGAA